ncbi:MAG: ABC transporter substrate-binding protein, partial [Paracoccaceae bacterium]|nr:ABC transporter substrate-binding protein [Paracoccaceae bacterium]
AFSTFLGADGMLAQEVIDQLGAENLGQATFTTSTSDESTPGYAAWKALATAADLNPLGPFIPNSYDAAFMMALAIEKAGSADRDLIAGSLRAIANAPGEIILPGEWAKAKKILAAGGDIHYNGGSGPQDFDANGDVAGDFSASVVQDGAWVGKIIK